MAETRLHTCMLCEAVCGLTVELEGGRAVSVRGDADDPFSHGHVCPKAAAIPDLMEDPDRVREPQRRDGDRWAPVSWRQALAEAGQRLAAIQRRHGPDSVALYLGNPTVHGFGASTAAILLSRALGSRSRFSATSVDQLPQMLASLEVLGHQFLLPVPDLDRTDFLLVLGANPRASNGSLMTAGDVGARLDALRARGGRMVVVDPRRTETAARADRHLAIRPGGDAALLLGLLHVLFAERLARPGRLAGFTDGLDRLEALAARFPPERVAARAGIAADDIRRLARDFAGAGSAVAYGRVGVCTQEFGGLASWLVLALNVVTGNLDRPGGAMFTSPAVDLVRRWLPRAASAASGRRVRGLPEFGGELPVAALAEEIETPRRRARSAGSSPSPATRCCRRPTGARLERALAGLEFMVSIDLYRNETTRHAHLILPHLVRLRARPVRRRLQPAGGARHRPLRAGARAAAARRARRLAGAPRPGAGAPSARRRAARLARRAGAAGGAAAGGAPAARSGPAHRAARALAGGPEALASRPRPGRAGPRLPERLITTRQAAPALSPERYQADLARLEAALDAPAAGRSSSSAAASCAATTPGCTTARGW